MFSIITKIIAIFSESILAIPVVGGSIIVAFIWIPLIVMLFIHILGIIFANIEGKSTTGHILGVLASILGFIPFLGWILHCVTFIVLITDVVSDFKNKNKNQQQNYQNKHYHAEIIPKNPNKDNSMNSAHTINSNYPVVQETISRTEHKKKS